MRSMAISKISIPGVGFEFDLIATESLSSTNATAFSWNSGVDVTAYRAFFCIARTGTAYRGVNFFTQDADSCQLMFYHGNSGNPHSINVNIADMKMTSNYVPSNGAIIVEIYGIK